MITKQIIKYITKNNEDYTNAALRTKLGAAAGVVGIFSNLFLTALKAVIGYVTGSISIVADAINNLSDMASSVVSVFGIYLSSKASDEEHPYGHGRGEYLATLIVAFAILFVGLNLIISSVKNILNPKPVEFSWVLFIVLLLSIGIKIWMYKFYKTVGDKIDSSTLKASSIDSLGDVLVTGVVVLSFLVSRFTDLPIDGIGGVFVSLFILKSGYDLINEMISEILGAGPSKELEKEILEYFNERKEILDTHDLRIHQYGPGEKYATIDAVVNNDVDAVKIHDIFTEIEYKVFEECGVMLTIHMDLWEKTCKEEIKLEEILERFVKENDEAISFHDEAVLDIDGEQRIIVDLVTDGNVIVTNEDEEKIINKLKNFIEENFGDCNCDIIIDKYYED